MSDAPAIAGPRDAWVRAAVAMALLFGVLYNIFAPVWGGNDDVGMSMIAHGYGQVAQSGPTLLFSNVLWGYLARALPTIHGVLGYSVLTFLSIAVAGTAIGWSMLRLGIRQSISFLLLALVMITPLLFPQFTFVSGLFAAAACLLAMVYGRAPCARLLVLACLFAFGAFLVRDREALLVGFGALPFLPWRALRRDRRLWCAIILLLLVVIAAWAFDRQFYLGPEWKPYFDFNKIRIDFTDYSATRYALQQPDLLARHGFTQNDLFMVGKWFFLDPQLVDPTRLSALRQDIGSLATHSDSAGMSIYGLTTFLHPILMVLLVPLVVFFWFSRDYRILITVGIIFAAQFYFSLMGRVGAMHVYQPMLFFLLAAAGASWANAGARHPCWVAALLVVMALVLMAVFLPPQQRAARSGKEIDMLVQTLPTNEPLFAWGASFPWEYMYPPLGGDTAARHLHIYTMGTFINAPFSFSVALEKDHYNALERLKTPPGILLVSSPDQLSSLAIYCAEKTHNHLLVQRMFESFDFSVYRVACGS